ncbi:MAG: nitrilase-related carbon-nitrogen hydrolase [Planctomycetota bacterium]
MKAHLFQLDLVWEDREANFRLVDRAVDSAEIDAGDLIVLPELFDSGFSLNVPHTADGDGSTLRFLTDLALRLGVTVHGSRTVAGANGRATNRATIVGSSGELLCEYAKIHPFTFGKEPEAFDGGDSVETYDWNGLSVCPAVCYDLRFPELFRRGLAKGAEVFALGANWPDARQHHWRALAIARAIENQAFVLAVNRTGPDPHLNYAGGTIAVDPMGDVLSELGDESGVLSVEIDADAVRSWRETFPAWRDMKLLPTES